MQTRDQRDQLALERTNLGNLRTFYAAIRTAISLLGLGAGFWKLFEHGFFHTLGIVALCGSIVVFAFGIYRFLSYRKFLKREFGITDRVG